MQLSPMTKSCIPTENSKKSSDNTKTPLKTVISLPLQAGLGRSLGVTKVIQPGVVKRFYLPTNHKGCMQSKRRTVKKIDCGPITNQKSER